jgi:hypothetical protein
MPENFPTGLFLREADKSFVVYKVINSMGPSFWRGHACDWFKVQQIYIFLIPSLSAFIRNLN